MQADPTETKRLHLLRKRRCVRGVPTSLNTVASVRPGRNASTLFMRASAIFSFFLSYSSVLSPCQWHTAFISQPVQKYLACGHFLMRMGVGAAGNQERTAEHDGIGF
jgi:hypothetical protein